MSNTLSSMDLKKFLDQFRGIEDVAQQAIHSFLDGLPSLIQAIELSINKKSPRDLEVSAHTLKGVVSNFFAEPSRTLAHQLEQLGHENKFDTAEQIFAQLSLELERLKKELAALYKV